MDFETFNRTIFNTMDKYAPLKKKYRRVNHSNFVTKELRKTIMSRSRLTTIKHFGKLSSHCVETKMQKSNSTC